MISRQLKKEKKGKKKGNPADHCCLLMSTICSATEANWGQFVKQGSGIQPLQDFVSCFVYVPLVRSAGIHSRTRHC